MFHKRSSQEAINFEQEVSSKLSVPESEDNLENALQSLAQAADAFEAGGMDEEAEVITQVMETIASGDFAMVKEAKKKHKAKQKKKSKKPKLSPNAMVRNMQNYGWFFHHPSYYGHGYPSPPHEASHSGAASSHGENGPADSGGGGADAGGADAGGGDAGGGDAGGGGAEADDGFLAFESLLGN